MTKISGTTVFQFVAIILLAVCAVELVLSSFADKKLEKRVDEIAAEKRQILNADSIASIIEGKILDSLTTVLKSQDEKIHKLTIDLNKTIKKSNDLQKRFNDIRVSLPEF